MDKFGIFNLLNSFFPLNSQSGEQSDANKSNSGLASTLISSLGKNLFQPKEVPLNSEQNSIKVGPAQSTPMPLQKNMILTINSHDEFVKRVKEKHEKIST